MTVKEKRKILKEAALIAEKAYRRGFQHGVWQSAETEVCLKELASKYRFETSRTKPFRAPQEYKGGKVCIYPSYRGATIVNRHIGTEAGGQAPILEGWLKEIGE